MNTLYKIENLRKVYEDHIALDLPHFTLHEGESIAVVGSNGSGKSTLLRLLAFLEKPTSGIIEFNAKTNFPRREVTLLLQEPYLLKENVFNNVVLGLRMRGEHGNLQEKYEQAMRKAGFNNPEIYAKRRTYQLSGGEKQRVALAARMILSPRALLLDEPTSNVDQKAGETIIEALLKIQATETSIICTTHEPQLIEALKLPTLKLLPPQSNF